MMLEVRRAPEYSAEKRNYNNPTTRCKIDKWSVLFESGLSIYD